MKGVGGRPVDRRSQRDEPAADFNEIEPSAQTPAEWLAEFLSPERAAADAAMFERLSRADPEYDAQIDALLRPAAESEEGPPRQFRYLGGCSRVPDQYIGQTCRLAVGRPPAKRLTSRRVEFRDGFIISLKAKLLEPAG